jgi:hypothetical protein
MPTCGAGRNVRRVHGRPQVLRPVEHDAVLPQHCRAVAPSLHNRKHDGQPPYCRKLWASTLDQDEVRLQLMGSMEPACLFCIEYDHLAALQGKCHVFVLTCVHLCMDSLVSAMTCGTCGIAKPSTKTS